MGGAVPSISKGPTSIPPTRRAAEYVRMSTKHQKYSTENQSDAIRAYAKDRGLEMVRTYADAGKSGLRIEGREALQRLIRDVQEGNADFRLSISGVLSTCARIQPRGGLAEC